MNCTQVEKLLPLHVGNDLPTEQAAHVSAHLEHCAACRALAAEFAASREWLSAFSAPRFDEATLDELRAAVRREITRVERPPALLAGLIAWWQPRFTMALVAMLLLLASLSFYIYRQQTRPITEAPLAHIDRDQKRNEPVPKTPAMVNENKPAVAVVKASTRRRSPHRSRVVRPTSDAVLPAQDVALNQTDQAQVAPEMTRIEFQTADPNIRIIWLTPKEQTAPELRTFHP